MTRNEFLNDVTEWWELIDFCSDEGCTITGDVTEKYQVEPWDALDDELLKKRVIRDCILF